MSVYADDLLTAQSACNKDMIVTSLQPEVDKVIAWSDKARLTLNTYKCETAFFSLDCAEAAWHTNITIDLKQMFCNPLPVFFGVRYDRQHTFAEHVQKLCQSMSGCLSLLHALGGTLWTVIRSTSRLCVACLNMQLQPGLLGCQLPPPVKSPMDTARAITGHVRSTPVEAVPMESPITTRFQTISLLIADEWAHLPPADDHRQTLFTPCA